MPSPSSLDIAALLGRLPLFSGLEAEELQRIAASAREVQCHKGDILFHRGDPCHGFHVVVQGQVKLAILSAQGSEKVVEIIGQGQSFGEAIMFMDKSYVVAAQALVDSRLLHLAKAPLFEELERNPRLCRKMLASLSMRLHRLVADVESYSLQSGKQRVIGFLLREAPEAQESGQVTIALSTSKGTIASRLNLTQEHFSRILHELVENQLIVVEGRRIHVPDLEQLQQFGM
ncbi:MAG: hypothetical protein RIR00_96 [Pseudomonadota bacterium]|jgi:CRP-like cAMP-binding protein